MNLKLTTTAIAMSVLVAGTAFAQTIIPDNAYSAVTGTISISPTPPWSSVVVGTNADNAYVRSPATVAATVYQEGSTTVRTNRPNVTTTQSFARYAFGNKEILQLATGSNNVSRFTLIYTNQFSDIDVAGLAYMQGTSAPVALDPNIFGVSLGNGISAATSTVNTNTGVPSALTRSTYEGFTAAILGSITGQGVLTGQYNYLRSHVFVNGTNRATNTYTTVGATGSFSGLWQDDPILPNLTNTLTAIAGQNFSLNYEGIDVTSYGITNSPGFSFGINGNGLITANPVAAATTTAVVTNTVTVRATNNVGATTSRTFKVVVVPQAPVIDSTNAKSGIASTSFSHQITTLLTNASSFAGFGLPVWASLNPTTGLITGTAASGTNVVQLSASNAAGVGVQTFTISVP